MTTVEKLIEELCPDGVPHQRLDSVLKIRNGRDYKHLGAGDVPVYGTGGIMTYVDGAAHPGPSVLIPRKGSLGNVYFVDEPFWTVDTIFYTEIDQTKILPKFLYHLLLDMKLARLNEAAGVPSLTQAVLNRQTIPVPPIALQEEIVRILDSFTKLEAELEAELEARRRQYEYYRDALLTFPPEGGPIRWATLGDVFDMRAGRSVHRSEIFDMQTVNHAVPVFGANGMRGYSSTPSDLKRAILIGRQGALCGNVYRSPNSFLATEHAVVTRPYQPELINLDWAYHKLTAMNLNQYATKSAQPGLSVKRISSVPIPIPPLEEQERIVAILDKFDALVNDISTGLPAEINARRKQYEYYRDKLLTFKELEETQ